MTFVSRSRLQVACLAWTELFIEDYQVGPFQQNLIADLRRLPLADEVRRVRPVPILNELGHNTATRSRSELTEFVQGLQAHQNGGFAQ